MIWAQWGLKDRLLADPDIWLCYQCNDCSTHCPRGARPGDVMAALRRETVLEHAVPHFLGKWVNQPRYLPLVLLIPTVLLGLAVLIGATAGGASNVSKDAIVFPYWSWLPHWLLISFFAFFSVLTVVVMAAGVGRFWKALKAADSERGSAPPAKSLGSSIASALKTVFTHNDFNTCTTERARFLSHTAVFYGFLALTVVAMWVVFISLTARFNPLVPDGFVYPFNFFSPWRVLANLGGLALVGGCAWMIWDRVRKGGSQIGPGTYFDWAFLGTLLAVGVTGLICEALHYARLEPHRYAAYFVHLVLVFALLMYLPYSKFAHLVYRTTAMVYAEYTGRNAQASAAVASQPQENQAPTPAGDKEEDGSATESTEEDAESSTEASAEKAND
jgi:quinone-modifying oxidoreductase subunit QmoC